jgi:uncharacterized membrane protein
MRKWRRKVGKLSKPQADMLKRFLRNLRDAFVSGLLAILPIGGTVYILWFLYQLINGMVGRSTPFGQTVERALGRWIPGMGIYMTVILILLIGFITRNFLGRSIHYYMERILFTIPGVRKMYRTLKQFSSAILRSDAASFKKVVMFEFPKEGINAIGLVTNERLGNLQDAAGEECILVYTPTAPNPLSGYMLIIPKRKVTYLDIPVDDALSMVLSSGSVLPESIQKGDKVQRPHLKLFKHTRR